MMKIEFKILTITAVLLVSLTTGLSINTIGEYGEEHVISTEKYTARLHTGEGLEVLSEHPITINNKFEIDMVPTVTVDGNPYKLIPIEGQEIILEKEKNEYNLEFMGQVDDIESTKELYIQEDRIKAISTLENIGRETKEVETSYEVKNLFESKAFYPSAVEEQTDNYMIFTNQDYKGNSLGAITNIPLKSEEPFSNLSEKEIKKTSELSPGEEITLEITFKPVNIWTEENQLNFPHRYSAFLENPLIETTGDLEVEIHGENPSQKIIEMLSIISDEKETAERGTFTSLQDVDLDKEELNSLEASIIYKEMCIQEKIPCRIVIGEDGEEQKFAWVKALENEEWTDINPFQGTRSAPDYKIVYQEPLPNYIEVSGSTVNESNYLQASKEILRERLNPLIYLGIVLAFTIILMTLIFTKSDYLIQVITEKISEEDIPMEGKCKILKKDMEDETCIQVLEKIEEENGEINIKKYAEDMEYSEDLIRHYINYLEEEGHIEIEERKRRLEEKEAMEAEKSSKITKKLSKIAESINLTLKQFILILVTVVVGIIAISILFLI